MTTKTKTSSNEFGSSKWWNIDVVGKVLSIVQKRSCSVDTIEDVEKQAAEAKNKFDQEKSAKIQVIKDAREEEQNFKKARENREVAFQINDAKKIVTLVDMAASQSRSADAFTKFVESRSLATAPAPAVDARLAVMEKKVDSVESSMADVKAGNDEILTLLRKRA